MKTPCFLFLQMRLSETIYSFNWNTHLTWPPPDWLIFCLFAARSASTIANNHGNLSVQVHIIKSRDFQILSWAGGKRYFTNTWRRGWQPTSAVANPQQPSALTTVLRLPEWSVGGKRYSFFGHPVPPENEDNKLQVVWNLLRKAMQSRVFGRSDKLWNDGKFR